MQEEQETCFSKLKGRVRSHDTFGIPVQLNFNKESTHNTFLGGCCSILAMVLMTVFILSAFF